MTHAPTIDVSAACAAALAEGAPPRYLDVRFDAARRPVRCSGSTIVAHLAPEQRPPFEAVHAALEAAGVAGPWAWLPPSSYHMTVYDLLLHDRRGPGFWPEGLAAEASDAEADAWMLDRMRAATTAAAPPPWRLRVAGLEASARSAACIGAALVPADDAENARLRAMRDDWAALAGLPDRPGHADYVFHVTLAYLVAWPDAAVAAEADRVLAEASAALVRAAPTLTLSRADACLFDDMTEFRPHYRIP